MKSLALLPPRDFTVFERQFPTDYYTQRAKTFTMYYYANEPKCEQ